MVLFSSSLIPKSSYQFDLWRQVAIDHFLKLLMFYLNQLFFGNFISCSHIIFSNEALCWILSVLDCSTNFLNYSFSLSISDVLAQNLWKLVVYPCIAFLLRFLFWFFLRNIPIPPFFCFLGDQFENPNMFQNWLSQNSEFWHLNRKLFNFQVVFALIMHFTQCWHILIEMSCFNILQVCKLNILML